MEHWHVTLEKSTYHWYDHVARLPESLETLKDVRTDLKNIQLRAKESTNKRFIYFIVTRPKVRIIPEKNIKQNIFSKKIKLKLSFGNDEMKLKYSADLRKITNNINPLVEITDRSVLVEDENGKMIYYDVHRFLQLCEFVLPAPSTVQYVGDTSTPFNRLLRREHRGLFDTVYNLGLTEYDYFIFTHVVSVTRHISHRPVGDEYFTLNLYDSSDYKEIVDLKSEAAVIENALIEYFYCEFQDVNRKRDRGKLRNALEVLKNQRGVSLVLFSFDFSDESDYFTFGSRGVEFSSKHSFAVALESNKLNLRRFSTDSEMVLFANSYDDIEQYDEAVT